MMNKRVLKPSAALYPVPVVLVSCGSMERPNIITIAWTGVLCSSPPTISVAIRPSRHSHGLIVSSGQFVINVPTVDQLEKVDFCGVVSGREVDKFEACGFTAVRASSVSAPLIAECPVNLECVVTQMVSLEAHDVFLARVETVHGSEEIMDSKGYIDAVKADPISFVTYGYYRMGERLADYGFTKGHLSP